MLIFVMVAATEGGVGEVSSLSLPLPTSEVNLSNSCGRTSAFLGTAAAARPIFRDARESVLASPSRSTSSEEAAGCEDVNEYLTRLHWYYEYCEDL